MISDEAKVIFVHIPRTGGHTATHVFGIYGRGHPKTVGGMHASPSKYIEVYPNKWNSYYKFTIVRNPFDRFVSIFSNGRRSELENIDINDDKQFSKIRDIFNTIVVHELPEIAKKKPSCPQMHWLRENNKKVYPYDKIIRFENYYDDMMEVLHELNYEPQIKIEPLYVSNRRNYKEYYNDKAKQVLLDVYREDFEYLGYSW
jgi:hypothetical protein